jgi:hypothetical protein
MNDVVIDSFSPLMSFVGNENPVIVEIWDNLGFHSIRFQINNAIMKKRL